MATKLNLSDATFDDYLVGGRWSATADDNVVGEAISATLIEKIVTDYNRDTTSAEAI